MAIIYSILVFFILVLIHELGHFAAAKFFDIKVLEFSIGMGPGIVSKKIGETKYSIRWLPIGGYVAMEGEDELSDDLRAFNNVSPAKKLGVLFSGAGMNFILAIIVATIGFMTLEAPTTTVGEVLDDSPAYESGLQSGDKVLAIDNQSIYDWDQIPESIQNKEQVDLKIDRDNEEINLTLTTKEQDGRNIIGITPEFAPARIKNPFSEGVKYTFNVSTSILEYVGRLITRQADTTELSGPIGIVKIVGESSTYGINTLLFLVAMLSANLGVVNLLPFPALDGGTILITIIEAIIGKDLPENVKIGINLIGFVFLMGFMLYITFMNDIFGGK